MEIKVLGPGCCKCKTTYNVIEKVIKENKTGIGAGGGVIVGIVLFNESKSPLKIFFLLLVIGSAIGLKLVG